MKTIRMRYLFAAFLFIAGAIAQAHDPASHHLASQGAPAKGGDFTLRSADGPISSKSFRGKVEVIYFGYTFCPDACPTTLSALGAALKQMNATEVAKIQPIFITLDPARDDAKRMQEYAHFFHPSMVGLIGNEKEISAVARQYGVLYEKQAVDSAANYVIDHSSFLYVVGPDGKLGASIPYGAPPAAIAASLRAALAPAKH